jgi:hypothetical protein
MPLGPVYFYQSVTVIFFRIKWGLIYVLLYWCDYSRLIFLFCLINFKILGRFGRAYFYVRADVIILSELSMAEFI